MKLLITYVVLLSLQVPFHVTYFLALSQLQEFIS